MYCKNCNEEYEGDLKHCPNCGDPLEASNDNDVQEEAGSSSESLGEEKESVMAESTEVSSDTIVSQDTEVEQQTKSNKKNIIIVSIIAVLIVGALAFALNRGSGVSDDPFDQLVNSYKKTLMADQIEMSSVMTIKDLELGSSMAADPNGAIIDSVIEDLQVKVNTKQDQVANQYEMDMIFAIRDMDFITMNLYFDNEGVALTVPEIYEQQFYVTWAGLSELVQEQAFVQVSFEEYVKLLTELENNESIKNFDETALVDSLRESLEEYLVVTQNQTAELNGQEIKGDKLSLSFTQDEMMVFSFDLVRLMLEDEQFMNIADEVINDFVDVLETTGDAESLYLGKADLYEMRNAVTELKNNKEQLFTPEEVDEIMNELMNQQQTDDAEFNSTYNFYVKGYELLGVEQESLLSMVDPSTFEPVSLVMNVQSVVESVNKKMTFTGLDKSNGIDIADLSEEEMENIMLEVQGNVMSLILFNPEFQEIIGAYNN